MPGLQAPAPVATETLADLVDRLRLNILEGAAAQAEADADPAIQEARARFEAAKAALATAKADLDAMLQPFTQRIEEVKARDADVRARIIAAWPADADKTILVDGWKVQRAERTVPFIAPEDRARALVFLQTTGVPLDRAIVGIEYDPEVLDALLTTHGDKGADGELLIRQRTTTTLRVTPPKEGGQ